MNFHGGNIYSYSTKLLDFSSNINPLGVPDSFKAALLQNMEEFTKYPDIDYIELRKAIGAYLNVEDISCIAVGNGAVELLYKAVQQSGKNTLIGLMPTFSEYSRAAKQCGIKYQGLAAFTEDYQSLDIKSLIAAADENSAVIICNPNNPTGTLTNKDQLLQLAEALKAKGALLIIDEAFMEFTSNYPKSSMLDQLSSFNNLIIVKAATKFFGMPGIRLGYAISYNKELLNKMRESMEPWNVNTAAVIAGCTVLKDEEYITASRAWIEEERNNMFEGLSSTKEIVVYPSAANFHLIKLLTPDFNAAELKDELLERGILIRTPQGFEGLDMQYARLAVKDKNSNLLLIKELRSIFKK